MALMAKYVVYTIWTESRQIEAKDDLEAYEKAMNEAPNPGADFNLCNWHIHKVEEEMLPASIVQHEMGRAGTR
jgi:hypothetical protein